MQAQKKPQEAVTRQIVSFTPTQMKQVKQVLVELRSCRKKETCHKAALFFLSAFNGHHHSSKSSSLLLLQLDGTTVAIILNNILSTLLKNRIHVLSGALIASQLTPFFYNRSFLKFSACSLALAERGLKFCFQPFSFHRRLGPRKHYGVVPPFPQRRRRCITLQRFARAVALMLESVSKAEAHLFYGIRATVRVILMQGPDNSNLTPRLDASYSIQASSVYRRLRSQPSCLPIGTLLDSRHAHSNGMTLSQLQTCEQVSHARRNSALGTNSNLDICKNSCIHS